MRALLFFMCVIAQCGDTKGRRMCGVSFNEMCFLVLLILLLDDPVFELSSEELDGGATKSYFARGHHLGKFRLYPWKKCITFQALFFIVILIVIMHRTLHNFMVRCKIFSFMLYATGFISISLTWCPLILWLIITDQRTRPRRHNHAWRVFIYYLLIT